MPYYHRKRNHSTSRSNSTSPINTPPEILSENPPEITPAIPPAITTESNMTIEEIAEYFRRENRTFYSISHFPESVDNQRTFSPNSRNPKTQAFLVTQQQKQRSQKLKEHKDKQIQDLRQHELNQYEVMTMWQKQDQERGQQFQQQMKMEIEMEMKMEMEQKKQEQVLQQQVLNHQEHHQISERHQEWLYHHMQNQQTDFQSRQVHLQQQQIQHHQDLQKLEQQNQQNQQNRDTKWRQRQSQRLPYHIAANGMLYTTSHPM